MTLDNKLQRIFNLISKITAIVALKRDVQVLLKFFSEGFRREWMGLVQSHLASPNCHRMPQMYACENHGCHWFKCLLRNGWPVAAVQF